MRTRLARAALLLALVAGPARAERVHVVQPGETLWSIAAHVAGDASLWPALFRANRDQIGDPAVLYPGQRLEIPPIESDDRQAPPEADPRTR